MFARLVLLAVIALLFSGCSTTGVALKYAPPQNVVAVAAGTESVSVGTFEDKRGEPATYLGAIRGGFGNPLKTLESSEPVAAVVASAFAEGLRARGIQSSGAKYQIGGTIKVLECIQMVRRDATVEIDVRLIATDTKKEVFVKTVKANTLDGSILNLATGVFASVEDLRAVTEKTLRDAVDRALDDPEFRKALNKS
jgi:uncharacterized lipoprotein YajG